MRPIFLLIFLFAAACAKAPSSQNEVLATSGDQQLYSKAAQEVTVQFEALYRTEYASLNEAMANKEYLETFELPNLMSFLFGPLTYRSLGAPQKGATVSVNMQQAHLENGRVVVPYVYHGLWLVTNFNMELPVPFNANDLQTPDWKNCTDPSPEHQTLSFYWYFWDPTRPGCSHTLGNQYQVVKVRMGTVTQQTERSAPEYRKMIRTINGRKVLAMTFAFGYVEDSSDAHVFTDNDAGVREFRTFLNKVKKDLLPKGFTQQDVTLQEYNRSSNKVIGTRFVGKKGNVEIRVTVVAAAEVDQMELFARSFAQDHEGFFGWFGHSRVGSGFDADRFLSMTRAEPDKYTVTNDYQLIYWSGCNSYSYYTIPFFMMKPNRTKGLDIISNGLPTYFMFNNGNADIVYRAIYNWETNTTYQSLIDSIEAYAQKSGQKVLVNVLGDEDNNP